MVNEYIDLQRDGSKTLAAFKSDVDLARPVRRMLQHATFSFFYNNNVIDYEDRRGQMKAAVKMQYFT